MSDATRRAVFGRRFARDLWRLLGIYWSSPDAMRGGSLLALAIALELGGVWANLGVADAERRIFDALQQGRPAAFLDAVVLFFSVALVVILVAAYRVYVRQALEIRWREGLTTHYLQRWIGPAAYVQDKLHAGEMDNPEQRIQEDVRDFVASSLGLSLSLLGAVATLLSFGGLLWTSSAGWPLRLDGTELRIPGLMLWVAIGYGVFSMWITHRVGRRLVPINYDRLRVEADFRYGLVRFRENAEPVAVARGEAVERHGARDRFARIVANWWQLIRVQRNLTLATTGIAQANGMVPVLVAAPAFFANLITFGTIAQIRFAYGQVSGALTWFVFAYQEIARWGANVERLATFADVMDATARDVASAGIQVVAVDAPRLRLAELRLADPTGRVLLDGASATVARGDRLVITGASGTGKTTLIRAIAGVWPFGAGRIELPARARTLFVTQWPYIPIGTLRAAVSYPAAEGTFPDERVCEVLRLLELGRLEHRLSDSAEWEQLLSPHEQQRLALARVLLHEPDWIFLDKATSALDEETERRVYELLAERLPGATLVSVAHSAAVVQHHARRWTLAPRSDGRVALEAA
jgi:putative ATP-binding cassette transporter